MWGKIDTSLLILKNHGALSAWQLSLHENNEQYTKSSLDQTRDKTKSNHQEHQILGIQLDLVKKQEENVEEIWPRKSCHDVCNLGAIAHQFKSPSFRMKINILGAYY